MTTIPPLNNPSPLAGEGGEKPKASSGWGGWRRSHHPPPENAPLRSAFSSLPLKGGGAKIIALVLVLAIALPLVACGKRAPPGPPPGEKSSYPKTYPNPDEQQ
jgi:predicted small lipoprotein YifL